MEKKNPIIPTNDYVFRRIFGHVGNEIITQGLLNAILDTKVTKVDLNQNTITEKDVYDDKIGILDIKATLNDEVVCNIEMQMLNQANLDRRILFYWSKLYACSIKQGENYGALKKTIAILIANFEPCNLKNIPKGHTKWQLREKDFPENILTEVCEIHIISLVKLMELIKSQKIDVQEKGLLQWTKFLITPEELEVREMENNEAIKKAIEELEKMQEDSHEKYLAELRLKHLLDTESIREGGFEEGLEKGKREKQLQIAKKLLQKGISIEVIMDSTELTRQEIEILKNEI